MNSDPEVLVGNAIDFVDLHRRMELEDIVESVGCIVDAAAAVEVGFVDTGPVDIAVAAREIEVEID
jgi:hypothetical protein